MSDICQKTSGDEDLGLWIFGAMSSLGLCVGYVVAALDWKDLIGKYVNLTTEQIALGFLAIVLLKTLIATMISAKEDAEESKETYVSSDQEFERKVNSRLIRKVLVK